MASPKDANKVFRDFILTRQHYLQRVENGTLKEMIVPYNAAKKEITKKLVELEAATAGYTTEWRMARLNTQLAEINHVLYGAALESAGTLENTMLDVAVAESDAYASMLASKFGTVGIDIVSLPYKHIDYAMSNPLLGESIGEKMLWGNQESIRIMKQELTQSVMMGEDMARARNRLLGHPNIALTGLAGKKLKTRMDMIARSEIQYISNQVARSVYNENQDVLKGLQATETLDRRTCIQCASIDGTIYKYKDGINNAPFLPRHPRCRGVYVPITKSWKELGINAKEFPKGTRASFSGQVLDTVTYSQWLRTQPVTVQKDILGPTRYKLWDDGELKLNQMATDKKILTVKELEKKAGAIVQ